MGSFLFRYPYEEESRWKRKFSVSELKRAAYEPQPEEEDGVRLFEKPEEEIIPKFRKGETKIRGAARGTAYHRILELLDFGKSYTMEHWKRKSGSSWKRKRSMRHPPGLWKEKTF